MSRIHPSARLPNPRRARAMTATCLAVAALVAGCGGGDRVKHFQANQIIAFGDENSAFDDTAAGPQPLVRFDGITPAAGNTAPANATVPYRARYTINLVADAPTVCKQSATAQVPANVGDCTPGAKVADSEFPSNGSFFVPSSSQPSTYLYATSNGVPLVTQVDTGSFNDYTGAAGQANPIYIVTQHGYECSVGFGGDYGNWVQRLAQGLGGGGLSVGAAGGGCAQDVGNGRSYATWGAKIDDVRAQVNAHLGDLHDGVLVTMLAGQNDVMAAYARVQAGGNEDNDMVLMREKGAQLAGIINDVVARGARVVYLTLPDMGRSPAAVANPSLANRLTAAFNRGYKSVARGESHETGGLEFGTLLNDGHKIVKADGYTTITNLGASYAAEAACESDPAKVRTPNGQTLAAQFPAFVALTLDDTTRSLRDKALLLNCRSNNLKVLSGNLGATPPVNEVRAYYGNYLWADAQRLSPLGHAALANLATARVRDQL